MKSDKDNLAKLRLDVLKEATGIGPWMSGSIAMRYRKCGNKGCGCHTGEKKHPVMYVTWKTTGKTSTLYVPKEMEADVRGWLDNYKKIRKLLLKGGEAQREAVRLRAIQP